MAEKTNIAWTSHTFNAWWGCAKVSPGCDNCYAERDAGRYQPGRNLWGVDAERRTFGDSHWNDPVRWNRKAAKEGTRPRVFCASMADVFDKNSPPGARDRLWALIKATPNLDWLILTKRVGNVTRMLPADWGAGYENVWLGISVVNQEEANRDISKLLNIPARIRFLSCEPLLGPVNLNEVYALDAMKGAELLDWVIVGGESGPKARPLMEEWATDIRTYCETVDTAFFMKQGSQANWGPNFSDFDFLPASLQVREWPNKANVALVPAESADAATAGI